MKIENGEMACGNERHQKMAKCENRPEIRRGENEEAAKLSIKLYHGEMASSEAIAKAKYKRRYQRGERLKSNHHGVTAYMPKYLLKKRKLRKRLNVRRQ
jgi:hypothetical protein